MLGVFPTSTFRFWGRPPLCPGPTPPSPPWLRSGLRQWGEKREGFGPVPGAVPSRERPDVDFTVKGICSAVQLKVKLYWIFNDQKSFTYLYEWRSKWRNHRPRVPVGLCKSTHCSRCSLSGGFCWCVMNYKMGVPRHPAIALQGITEHGSC